MTKEWWWASGGLSDGDTADYVEPMGGGHSLVWRDAGPRCKGRTNTSREPRCVEYRVCEWPTVRGA